MRRALIILFCFLAAAARGQEQERKLVDRLLKPDAALANPEQNKKFTASAVTSGRSVNTRSFYVQENRLAKNFSADRHVATTSFATGKFPTKDAAIPKARPLKTYPTRGVSDISAASNTSKSYRSGDFAGNRPFLVHGKSQKSLDAQRHPLSIEEVRELLNKNK